MGFRPKPKKPSRVIIFSTPTCGYCNMAKQYFRRHKIRFRDVDVSQDPAAARDLVRRSGQMGVPVIDINGKIIVGFDKPKINSLLDIKE
ncbi:MAG: NrdH-redoxin [Anaerolineales bacterium]|nr:NrdH-redoxin [Anaerolineales bacterium]